MAEPSSPQEGLDVVESRHWSPLLAELIGIPGWQGRGMHVLLPDGRTARLLALLRTSPAATTAPKGGEVSLVPEAGDLAEAVPAGALSVGDKVAREVTQNTQGE